jgi:hypothetical protein
MAHQSLWKADRWASANRRTYPKFTVVRVGDQVNEGMRQNRLLERSSSVSGKRAISGGRVKRPFPLKLWYQALVRPL